MGRLSDALEDIREGFSRLSLRGKITTALLAAALTLGIALTLFAYLLVSHQARSQILSLLEAQTQLERREIELPVASMVALADSLAEYLATTNGQSRPEERERVPELLLSSPKLLVAGATLTVTDRGGKGLASSIEPRPDYNGEPAFAAMMQSGRPQARLIVRPGSDAAILLALPVADRVTGKRQGGVVLHAPLNPLLAPATETVRRVIKAAGGTPVAGQTGKILTFVIEAPLTLPASLGGLKLNLMVTRDGEDAMRSINRLLGLLLTAGVFVVVGILALARASARFVTTPLSEISAAAEQIAAAGRPVARLPEHRTDELGRLSAAFNTMVDRLAESYAELEHRVAERTREHEESQHEAEKAGNLLREAVSSIAQGFTIYDENDRLVHCNEAYKSFYETSRDLIVPGSTFEEIVRKGAERGQYAEATENIDAWVKARVAQHQSAKGEVIEQRLGDGRWLMIVEYRTPSGYIAGNRIDITEIKRATEALRRRDLYQRATLDNLPFLFWLKDAEGRILAVNEVFAKACGRATPEEVVGLTDFDVWPPELAERYRAHDLEVIASRREAVQEERILAGSRQVWSETFKKPVIGDDGRVIGLVGFSRDITDRREAMAWITEHSEQLNAIFALSPDGFVSFDGARRVKYASPAFTRLTGLGEDEVIGITEADFSARLSGKCIDQARFQGVAAMRKAQAVPSDLPRSDALRGRRQVIELTGPDKRVLEVDLRESQAETVSQILYLRDITHETEVDRLKSEFLSHAAHELRTPMASIHGYTELMLTQEFGEADRRDFLGTIFRQSELMISIINELLDLARIEARRGKDFVIAELDVRQLLHEVVGGFKTPAGRPSPHEPPADGVFRLGADRKKLTQAINNVLSNAYKYSGEGGTVSIELVAPAGARNVAGDGRAGMLGIRIRDQGIGMTPEQLARVCERFYRADTSGKIPGTGLGMSIVKEIIMLHGGDMQIESTPSVGTTVTLWLPCAVPHAATKY